MSSDVVINVDGLGKVFPIYAKPHHRLLQMLSPRSKKHRWFREFRALEGVSFDVRQGETLGIVGRNGSGKSTLLQIICGTLSPSVGEVSVRGRVAALLELGAGFNPEFTGRENVYLNGTVLGLTRDEINEKFDEILDFAEIGEFIDQPVKSYSSGMYIRLAFAVAINVTPDILIVDEALSVGDEAFQRKCFARIQNLRDGGATILFVSHSAGIVSELCDRAVLLDHGELLAIGAPKFVISRYHKLLYSPVDRAAEVRAQIKMDTAMADAGSGDLVLTGSDRVDAELVLHAPEPVHDHLEAYFDEGMVSKSVVHYESRGAVLFDATLTTVEGKKVNVVRGGSEYVYGYTVTFEEAASAVRFGMMIKTLTGSELGGSVSSSIAESIAVVEAGKSVRVRFRFRCLLAPGAYFMNAGVTGRLDDAEGYLHRAVDVLMFRVMPDAGNLATGMVDFLAKPSIEYK
jgi:lipopolysaccharide transport system ATP-binding protein